MATRVAFVVVMWKDRAGEWRWTVHSRNGKKVGTSGEGYKRRRDCRSIARKLFPGLEILDT